MLEELRTGFRYVVGFPPVRTSLILLALVSAMGMPYTVLMPVIATERLSRRRAHARLPDDGVRTRRRRRRALPRVAPERARPRPSDGVSTSRSAWGSSRSGFVRSFWVALLRAAGRRRRIHGADGGDEHDPPDDHRRESARPSDGVLHDGVPRHGADRQPPRRRRRRRISARRHDRRRRRRVSRSARSGWRSACRRCASTFGRSTSSEESCRPSRRCRRSRKASD